MNTLQKEIEEILVEMYKEKYFTTEVAQHILKLFEKYMNQIIGKDQSKYVNDADDLRVKQRQRLSKLLGGKK